MTDNEIIKALECCMKTEFISDCAKCEMLASDCKDTLIENALDLINRQKAEIERLTETLDGETTENMRLKHEIEKLENESYRAKVEISKHYDYMDKAANEAIDVFANSLKIKLNRMIDNLVKEMTEVETNQRKEDEGK